MLECSTLKIGVYKYINQQKVVKNNSHLMIIEKLKSCSILSILRTIKEDLNATVLQCLADLPCCSFTREYGWSDNIERIMKAQALRNNKVINIWFKC